jgi:hypothetical protein
MLDRGMPTAKLDATQSHSRPFAYWSGLFNRVLLWGVLATGLGCAIIGGVGMVLVPLSTIASIQPREALTKMTGTIADVTGPVAANKSTSNELQILKNALVVQATGNQRRSISLDTGYFVARDLDRRCGLDQTNLHSIKGQTAELLLDGNRLAELRIGRVLCVKYASAEREASFGGELRRRAFWLGPMLLIGGLLIAGSAWQFLRPARRHTI